MSSRAPTTTTLPLTAGRVAVSAIRVSLRLSLRVSGSILMVATLALILADAVPAGAAGGIENDDREVAAGFRLDLDELPDEPQRGFSLDLVELPEVDSKEAPEVATEGSPPALELTLSTQPGGGTPRSLIDPDMAEELRRMRWPTGVGRLEHAIVSEQAMLIGGSATRGRCRAAKGAAVNCAAGPMLDIGEVYRIVTEWWQTLKERRKPAGARLPRTARLTLQVREADGSHPGDVNVLPLTLGWVSDAVPAGCDGKGRCLVEGLPAAAGTVLVRGRGAALVRVRSFDQELPVVLRPVGWLLLAPSGEEIVEVHVFETATELTVPVVRWLNPGRLAWAPVSVFGLPLLLPAGEYTVETRADDGGIDRTTVTVLPEGRTELVVPRR